MISNTKTRIKINLPSSYHANTSFLIPKHILSKLSSLKKERFSLRKKIKYLLNHSIFSLYGNVIGKSRTKLTKSYQDRGENLKKVSCRINNEDLIELDTIAYAVGVSRSKLLVFMLEWEALGWLKAMRKLGFVRDTTLRIKLESSYNLAPSVGFNTPYHIDILHCLDS
ncbi:DUF1564 family protein [Leptospira idonii]|uniref:DUF1564 family protein n=1 Tax=Leptospira idonii TaxID=1193500 RepID=UPI00143829D1|nr:DUF1564 family protein [Leptospira idonii]